MTQPAFTSKASFGKRALASILDALAVGIIVLPSLLIYVIPSAYTSMPELASSEMDALMMAVEVWQSGGVGTAAVVVSALLMVVYVLLEPLTGASPAKRVLRLQIARQDGTSGNWKFFLLRAVVKNCSQFLRPISAALSGVVSLVMTLGCLAALGEKRLALHDILAKSAVYDVTLTS